MTRTLTVEFVKITDRSCLARARRLDRAVIETMATARDGLPHDLEHLVVETALDCGNGFWGRVWRGAEFDSIRVATSGPRRRLARPGLANDPGRREGTPAGQAWQRPFPE
jgi:hypothetical protein